MTPRASPAALSSEPDPAQAGAPVLRNRPLIAALTLLAIALVVGAILLRPSEDPTSLDVAGAHLIAGRVAEAERALREGIEMHPDDAGLRVMLAGILSRRGQVAVAITHLQEAVASDRDHAVAHHNLGGLLMDTERFDEAVPLLERCIALTEDEEPRPRVHATAWPSLARCREALGDIPGADEAWQRAMELGPDNPSVFRAAGAYAMRRERWEAACDVFGYLVRFNPRDPDYVGGHARALQAAGRSVEAIEAWRYTVSLDESDMDNLLALAYAEYEQHEREHARELCEIILEMDPDNEAALDLQRHVTPMRITINPWAASPEELITPTGDETQP